MWTITKNFKKFTYKWEMKTWEHWRRLNWWHKAEQQAQQHVETWTQTWSMCTLTRKTLEDSWVLFVRLLCLFSVVFVWFFAHHNVAQVFRFCASFIMSHAHGKWLCALRLRVRLEQFKKLYVAHVLNHLLLSSYWTVYRLRLVVGRAEENVGEGGSRSSWPIHEHENSELVSQQNVAFQVFGSQCSPRSAMIARYLAPVLSCAVLSSTLKLLLSLDERVRCALGSWCVSRPTTGCSVLSCSTASSWKERVSISWERDVFLPPCAILKSLPTKGCSVLSWSGFGFGWFKWELLNCCTTCPSGRWATSEPNSFIQSCFKEILGRCRSDASSFSFLTSKISILTAFGIS